MVIAPPTSHRIRIFFTLNLHSWSISKLPGGRVTTARSGQEAVTWRKSLWPKAFKAFKAFTQGCQMGRNSAKFTKKKSFPLGPLSNFWVAWVIWVAWVANFASFPLGSWQWWALESWPLPCPSWRSCLVLRPGDAGAGSCQGVLGCGAMEKQTSIL